MRRPTDRRGARDGLTTYDSDWPDRDLTMEMGSESWRPCWREPSGPLSARRPAASPLPALAIRAYRSARGLASGAESIQDAATPSSHRSRSSSREVWMLIRDGVKSLARWRSRPPGSPRDRELPRRASLVLTTSDSSTVEGDSPSRCSDARPARCGPEVEDGARRGSPAGASGSSTPSSLLDDSAIDLEGGKSGWMLFRRGRTKGVRAGRGCCHRRSVSKPDVGSLAYLSYRRSRSHTPRRLAASSLGGAASSRSSTGPANRRLSGIPMDPRRPRIRLNARRADRYMGSGSGDAGPDRMFALLQSEPDIRPPIGRDPAGSPVSWDSAGGPGHDRQDSGPSWSASGYAGSDSGTEIMPASSCGARELPDVDEEAELVVECSPWIGLQYERTIKTLGRRRTSGAGASSLGPFARGARAW